MQTLNLITWNVRGFHTTSKRIQIINHLIKLKADICFLQETHLTNKKLQNLYCKQFNKIFSSTFNSKQRGVSILINKNISFTLNSCIIDPEERFIIINISINQLTFTLANIYAPNNDDPLFYHNLFSLLYNSTNLIVAGDFNTVLNPLLDRTHHHSNTRICHSSDVIKQYMTDYGLGDSWRARNPSLREYSHISSAHRSSSRIDFFLISNSLIQQISENIHSIIISDHAPVSLTLNTPVLKKTSTRWRFNTSLLEDLNFTSLIKREWAAFLEMNESPDISPSTLWETGKAVMRGIIISYSSHKKKQQQQLENTLEQKIKQLSNQQSTSPSEETQIELKQLKTQLDSIIHKKTQFCIQQLKYDQSHLSNKAGKYLANMLQYKRDKSLIPSILDTSGKPTQDPQEMNNTFHQFYSSLYSPGSQPSQFEIYSFLNNLDLPSLTIDE